MFRQRWEVFAFLYSFFRFLVYLTDVCKHKTHITSRKSKSKRINFLLFLLFRLMDVRLIELDGSAARQKDHLDRVDGEILRLDHKGLGQHTAGQNLETNGGRLHQLQLLQL